MDRWTYCTPCDRALANEDHDPHDYTHADQMFWCDGEAVESTPIDEVCFDWLDELDWEKVTLYWGDERFVPPEERESVYKRFTEWCFYSSAPKFYITMVCLALAIIFGYTLIYNLYLEKLFDGR